MADQFIVNPFTGRFDDIGSVTSAGATFTGDVIFPANGFLMTDSNGLQWRIKISTSGVLVTSSTTGSPMGLLLSLTYS